MLCIPGIFKEERQVEIFFFVVCCAFQACLKRSVGRAFFFFFRWLCIPGMFKEERLLEFFFLNMPGM